MQASVLGVGCRVMVVRLETQIEYNGRVGTVMQPHVSIDTLRVRIRLDTDLKKLSLQRKNVLSLAALPCYTHFLPEVYCSLDPLWWSPCEHIAVAPELEKGEGVVAKVDLHVGMRLRQVPDQKMTHFFRPASGGWPYQSDSYSMKMSPLNTPVLAIGIHCMLDRLHAVLSISPDLVCQPEERYTADLCGKGGCRNCGYTVLCMAALKQIDLHDETLPSDSDQYPWFADFAVDEERLVAHMQLNEILLLVNYIANRTREIEQAHRCSLNVFSTRAQCDELTTNFVAYAWHVVAVWKTNAFASYMELGSVSVLQDPLLPEKTRAGNVHMASWKLALNTIIQQLQDTDRVHTDREKQDLYDKAMCITVRMDETRALLETSVQTYGNSTGTYKSLGHAVKVTLHEPHITKINGAKPGGGCEHINCHLVEYVHKESGGAIIPDDLETYLCIDKDVPAGSFLCIAYNDGSAASSAGPDDYFVAATKHTLKDQAAESSMIIVELIQETLSKFSKYMPAYLVRHLQLCVNSAKSRHHAERFANIAELMEFVNIDT